jgi:hypothetical protein
VVWCEDGPATLVNGNMPWICCRYIWGKCRSVVTLCLPVSWNKIRVLLLTIKGLEGHYGTNFGNKFQLSADIILLGIILEEGEMWKLHKDEEKRKNIGPSRSVEAFCVTLDGSKIRHHFYCLSLVSRVKMQAGRGEQ